MKYRANISDLMYIMNIQWDIRNKKLALMCKAFEDFYGIDPLEFYKALLKLKEENPKAIKFKAHKGIM